MSAIVLFQIALQLILPSFKGCKIRLSMLLVVIDMTRTISLGKFLKFLHFLMINDVDR